MRTLDIQLGWFKGITAASAAIVILTILTISPQLAEAATGWSEPVKISGDVELFITPNKEIALDFAGHLHLTWMAGTDINCSQIYHTDNTSGSWPLSPTMLSTYPGAAASMHPQLAVDSDGYAHVVWCGEEGSNHRIYYADNTTGWPAIPTRIPETPSSPVKWPQIAVDSNSYSHVVWPGFDSGYYQILYANNSSGWPTTPTSISNDPHVLDNAYPKMALDSSGFAHVVWEGWDGTSSQIYYADNTSGWPALQTRLSVPEVHGNLESQIEIDSDGCAHVVWMGGPITHGNIYYSDNAYGWPAEPTALPSGMASGQNLYPQIAVDSNGYSHVVWEGNTADGLAALYADNTSGWPTSPTSLTPVGSSASGFPQIATDSRGYAHVAWLVDTGGVNKVYYANNISGAQTNPIDVGGDTFQETGLPQIALDSHDRPHIVWNGKSGSETGIYYSRLLPTPSPCPTPTYLIPASGDYNGDKVTDLAVFRPELGLWIIRGLGRLYFGREGDIPAPGDYDGDGLTDPAYFRPDSCFWKIKGQTSFYFERGLDNMPAPADYDGDGTCDPAVFYPTEHNWVVRGLTRVGFGQAGDLAVPGDYDGDGSAEMAVFRNQDALWIVRGITRFYFGKPGDIPVPGVYSWSIPLSSQAAVFRPDQGLWIIRGLTRYYFGTRGDQPVRGHFIEGILDQPGFFRAPDRLWKTKNISRLYFGESTDIPISR